MRTFTIETIFIENVENQESNTAERDEEQDAINHFIDRAREKGFSELEIKAGLEARILEWRNYKLIIVDE